MKLVLRSALVALFLFCVTAGSQAQGEGSSISGPNILRSLFGVYQGDFRTTGHVLPFTGFNLSIYPNGYVNGNIWGTILGSSSTVCVSVYGMANRQGNFDARFYYGGKYYSLKGVVTRDKKVIAVAKPHGKNNAVGTLNGMQSKTSYALNTATNYYFDVSGNGVNIYLDFNNDGTTFYGYDYNTTLPSGY